jgi:hypothetical protein
MSGCKCDRCGKFYRYREAGSTQEDVYSIGYACIEDVRNICARCTSTANATTTAAREREGTQDTNDPTPEKPVLEEGE